MNHPEQDQPKPTRPDRSVFWQLIFRKLKDIEKNMRRCTRLLEWIEDKFSNFYFMSYGWFCSQFSGVYNTDQKCSKIISSQKMRNVLKLIFQFFFVRFLVFDLWSVLYFTSVVHLGVDEFRRKKFLNLLFLWGLAPHTLHRGFRSPASDAFGLNPPSQLVLGHHW